MRLPTNHIALTAIGFVALVALAPLLIVLIFALRYARAIQRPGRLIHRAADSPTWMTTVQDFCTSESGALRMRWSSPLRVRRKERQADLR